MLTVLNCVILPIFVWFFYCLSLPNQRWEFDFDQMHGTFNILLGRYLGLALLDRKSVV